nr:hypothetical protein [Haloquadratum walsbyi]
MGRHDTNPNYKACVTAHSTARDALYDELRADTDLTLTSLQMQTLCKKARQGIRRAVQAVTGSGSGCVERWNQPNPSQAKRVSQPEFTSWRGVESGL